MELTLGNDLTVGAETEVVFLLWYVPLLCDPIVPEYPRPSSWFRSGFSHEPVSDLGPHTCTCTRRTKEVLDDGRGVFVLELFVRMS